MVVQESKGKPVFILVDPEGTPCAMQAYSNFADPILAFDTLKILRDG